MTGHDGATERRFVAGVLAAALLLAAALVTLVLALSVTVRDPVAWLPPWVRTAALAGGTLAVAGAALLRRRAPRRARRVAALGVVVSVLAGATAVAPDAGAPTVSQVDRWALAVASLALAGAGVRALRRALARLGR